jgi:hypothetical protein
VEHTNINSVEGGGFSPPLFKMENIMDEKLVQRYVDMLSGKVNELGQENVLLKAKLSLASEEITLLKQANQETNVKSSDWTQEEVEDDNSNKAKKK